MVNAALVSFSTCAEFNFTAPFSDIFCINLSATPSSTKTCFSPMHKRLLSNAAPEMIALAVAGESRGSGMLGPLGTEGNPARREVQVTERCGWARGDKYIAYHDEEWGVPLHDDRAL